MKENLIVLNVTAHLQNIINNMVTNTSCNDLSESTRLLRYINVNDSY